MDELLYEANLEEIFPYCIHVDLHPEMYQFLENDGYNEQMFFCVYEDLKKTIFHFFQDDHKVVLIINKYSCHFRKKDKLLNKIIKHMNFVELSTRHHLYQCDGAMESYTRLKIKTTYDNIKWSRLIKSIINQDFPDRVPQFNMARTPAIFLVSEHHQAILYPYDDRGFYIYAKNKENKFLLY